LDDEDARVILAYLLSTSNCNYIHGLPLVPSVSGRRITLQLTAFASFLPFHVMFDEIEETLFGAYDAEAISLQRILPTARQAIREYGTELLNVVRLRPPQVIGYLVRSPYASQTWTPATVDQIKWLNLFWRWAEAGELSYYAARFFLVPTTTCMLRPIDPVFDPQDDATELTHPLEALGIPVIDPRFEQVTRSTIPSLQTTSNIYRLLRALSPSTLRYVNLSERDCRTLCAYLLRHLPRVVEEDESINQDPSLFNCFKSLPIFPVILISEDGQLTTSRGSIPVTHHVRGVNPLEVPIIPQLNKLVYINLNLVNIELLKYLNSPFLEPLTPNDMQKLMLEYFTSQSPEMRLAFVKYLSELAVPPREIIHSLKFMRFMLASNGTSQTPEHLIDPRSSIAALFSAPSHRLPSSTHPTFARLSELLSELNLFGTRLSIDIIKECVRSLDIGRCHDPEGVARCLISLLNDVQPNGYRSLDLSFLSLTSNWIPTTRGLKSPMDSRDFLSHEGKTDLFDEAMPLVNSDVAIGPHLRCIFGWNKGVSVEVMSKQVTEVLNSNASLETQYRKVYAVVQELGTRNLEDEQFSFLRRTLNHKKWVPTHSKTLETVEFALLGEDDIPEAGFHSITFNSIRYPQVRSFLSIMGCVERCVIAFDPPFLPL